MKVSIKKSVLWLTALMLLVFACGTTAPASQDDNSLRALGITTEGAVVTPEFQYDIWSYDVEVPTGTTQLELSPEPSSQAATIADISDTTLDAAGNATVFITVRSGSGSEFTYTLNVVTNPALPGGTQQSETAAQQSEAAAAAEKQTEAPQTQPQTESETEPVTEDSRYVKVDKNAIQEAENTITRLKGEITEYRDTVDLYTKLLYGLIAACVLLLFLVINLILRKRDLKAELNDYRRMGYGGAVKKGKEKKKAARQGAAAPRQPQQGRPGNMNAGQGVPGQGAVPGQQGRPMNQNAGAQGRSANMQGRPAGGAQYYPQGARLDVMPQTSQHKGRKPVQPRGQAPQSQAQAPQQAAQQAQAQAPQQAAPQSQAQTPQQAAPQSQAQAPQQAAQQAQAPQQAAPQPQVQAPQQAAQQPQAQAPQTPAPQPQAQTPQTPAPEASPAPQSQGSTPQSTGTKNDADMEVTMIDL